MRDNNFRIIRHIAATAVIFSHAFSLNGGYAYLSNEPLKLYAGMSFAEIAVNIFFIASGFLVTQSILSRGSVTSFILSRALRIYPALVTVVCLTALVFGPVVSTLSLSEYFSYKYVFSYVFFDGLALSPFHTRFALPGVFVGNPVPSVVNGSLWTLPWEVWMYIALAGLLLARADRGKTLAVLWVALMTVHALETFDVVAFRSYDGIALRFSAYFFTGAFFYRYRAALPLNLTRQLVVTIMFIAVTLLVRNAVLLPIFLSHTVLFLALYQPLVVRRLSGGADFSYGIYLYSYPVQQLVVYKMGRHDPYFHTLIALALTLPLAALSWYLVERPTLGLKPRIIDFASGLLCRDRDTFLLRRSRSCD